MMDSAAHTRKRQTGISIKSIVIPAVVIILMLQVTVLYLIVRTDRLNSRLIDTMQKSSEYISAATSLLAGATILSETSGIFIHMPVTPDGDVIWQPLNVFAEEIGKPERRGDQVTARFEEYEVSEEVRGMMREAAEQAGFLLETQLHALALMSSVYPLPDIPPLKAIPMPALTAEETALPEPARESLARQLIDNQEYSKTKSYLQQNVNDSCAAIRAALGRSAEETSLRLSRLRTLLWVSEICAGLILICVFIVLFRELIYPLIGCSHLIMEDRSLDEDRGVEEVRQLAAAYNALQKRRDALDRILRSAAATDVLTGLSNRYGFEKYLLECDDPGHSLALILFDVNFLKNTNDTYGHAAGDKLLTNSADCIRRNFGIRGQENCFRFGGDEFAAVLKDVSRADVDGRIAAFRSEQPGLGISVSWGLAYTQEIGFTTMKNMMDEADNNMYECKKVMHAARDAFVPGPAAG